MGFPIRTSRDHSFIASSPTLFAGLHVLRRLSSPRHPPDALIHLTLSFQELLWLCLIFRWLEHQTWISYSDKAYCLLCLNPAFCLSGLSRYNHHPNTVPVFLFLFRRQLTVCNRSIIKNRHIVFVCWFRLSNLLKIDASIFHFANQNKLLSIAGFLWFVKCLVEANGIEPMTPCLQSRCSTNWAMPPFLVGLGGLEPPTPRLSSVCSNQLSYKPGFSS